MSQPAPRTKHSIAGIVTPRVDITDTSTGKRCASNENGESSKRRRGNSSPVAQYVFRLSRLKPPPFGNNYFETKTENAIPAET
jgi:hypothetical protein